MPNTTTRPLERCDSCFVSAWDAACVGDDLAREGLDAEEQYAIVALYVEVGRLHVEVES